ncbi:EF-hand domain-containing protein [Polaromonas sp.]|uniref:EF-hand domain-containing protein n=1 Tax=Polaromonas sp. TaxID=1869339 RepID=UPI003264E178
MTFSKLAAAFVVASTVLAAGSAFAQAPANAEYYPLSEIMSMKMIDKNKDGMVSKQEYMDMMSMAWDMNAKKMNTKGDKMTSAEFNQILMYLKAGG